MTMIETTSIVVVSTEPVGPDHWSWQQVRWANEAWLAPLSDLFVGFDPSEVADVVLVQSSTTPMLRGAFEQTAFSQVEKCAAYEVWVRAT